MHPLTVDRLRETGQHDMPARTRHLDADRLARTPVFVTRNGSRQFDRLPQRQLAEQCGIVPTHAPAVSRAAQRNRQHAAIPLHDAGHQPPTLIPANAGRMARQSAADMSVQSYGSCAETRRAHAWNDRDASAMAHAAIERKSRLAAAFRDPGRRWPRSGLVPRGASKRQCWQGFQAFAQRRYRQSYRHHCVMRHAGER